VEPVQLALPIIKFTLPSQRVRKKIMSFLSDLPVLQVSGNIKMGREESESIEN